MSGRFGHVDRDCTRGRIDPLGLVAIGVALPRRAALVMLGAKKPLIARRSSPSITSTTKRARCFSGSHSSTDGGNRNPVCRSIVRKLLIRQNPSSCENQCDEFYRMSLSSVKPDRLLEVFDEA